MKVLVLTGIMLAVMTAIAALFIFPVTGHTETIIVAETETPLPDEEEWYYPDSYATVVITEESLYSGITPEQWQLAIEQTVALAEQMKSDTSGPLRPKMLAGVNTLKERHAIYRKILDAEDRKTIRTLKKVLHYGGAEAMPVLIEAIESSNTEIRYAILELLGNRGFDGVDPLITVLNSTDKETGYRDNVAHVLRGTQCPKAMPHLLNILKDENSGLRYRAMGSLSVFSDPVVFDAIVDYLNDESDKPHPDTSKILGIIGTLKRLDYDRAKPIVLELANTFEHEKGKWLTASDLRKRVSERDTRYQGEGPWPQELEPIVQLARDAHTIAGESYTENQKQLLIDHINHTSAPIRSLCVNAITHLGDARALPAIMDSCRNNTAAEDEYSALVSFATPQSLEFYVQHYNLADYETRQIMARSLKSSSKKAVPLLMVMLNDSALHHEKKHDTSPPFRHLTWPEWHNAHRTLVNLLKCGKNVDVNNFEGEIPKLEDEIQQLKQWWSQNAALFLQNKKVSKPPILTDGYSASSGGGVVFETVYEEDGLDWYDETK